MTERNYQMTCMTSTANVEYSGIHATKVEGAFMNKHPSIGRQQRCLDSATNPRAGSLQCLHCCTSPTKTLLGNAPQPCNPDYSRLFYCQLRLAEGSRGPGPGSGPPPPLQIIELEMNDVLPPIFFSSTLSLARHHYYHHHLLLPST